LLHNRGACDTSTTSDFVVMFSKNLGYFDSRHLALDFHKTHPVSK
jgi:hypothetical protein